MKRLKALLLCIALLSALCGVTAQTSDWLWAQRAGGTDGDNGWAIAADNSGNTYVTGYFKGTLTFGDTTINSVKSNIFVVKLDGNGDCLWATSAEIASYAGQCTGYGIAVDSADNVYVTGQFSGTVIFGSTTLISLGAYGGSNDILAAKLDSAGNWLWAKRVGGIYDDKGACIVLDSAGNAYLSGFFQETATFGSTTLTSSSGWKIFVAKLDSSGNWLWAKQAGGTNSSMSRAIALDSSGNIYLTGNFNGTATFASTDLFSNGGWDIFVAKLDANGNWVWAQKAGGTDWDDGYSIAVDSSSNIYLTGKIYGTVSFGTIPLTSSGTDIFVAKLDSNGNWLWAKRAGGTGEDCGYGVALDGAANIYLTGCFKNTATFGTIPLTSSGDFDIFVAKLDSGGTWLQANRAGGTSEDAGWGITLDSAANVYVTGYFKETATFGNTTPLISGGRFDIFVAKFGIAVPLPKVPQNLQIQRSGQNIIIGWDPVTQDTNNQPLTPDAYMIYVSENNSDWVSLATVTSIVYSYTDTTLDQDRKFYRVIAMKD